MAKKYRTTQRRRSRLAKVESKKFARQTTVIVIAILALLVALIFFGIPALIKLAIFFGDVRDTTTPVEQTDTIPPAAPQISIPYEATSSASISMDGFAEPGSNISLYKDNVEVETTTTDDSGQFSFASVQLANGSNTFYTKATDQAGNESQQSRVIRLTRDNQSPKVTITSPADGDRFFGADEQTIDVQGTVDESEVQVMVNDRFVVVSTDGSFSTRYQLEEGDNTIEIKAIDAAKNESTTSLTVNFTR